MRKKQHIPKIEVPVEEEGKENDESQGDSGQFEETLEDEEQVQDFEFSSIESLDVSAIPGPDDTPEDPLQDESQSFHFDETKVSQKTEAQLTFLLNKTKADEDLESVDFWCPLCLKQFQGKTAIQEHVQRYFKFHCETCKKKFFKRQYLKRHLKNAHLESQQLECTLCKQEGKHKVLRALNNLKLHLLLHSNERRFRCPEENCGQAFKQKPGLQQHLRKKHKTRARRVNCPFCADLVENLREHVRTQHTEKEVNLKLGVPKPEPISRNSRRSKSSQ